MTGNIDDPPVPNERADFGEALGVLGDDFERAWLEVIVRVQPTENIAGGEHESSVDCLGLSPVLLAHPAGEKLLIAFDDVDAVVAAAPVHDDVFKVRVSLIEDRQNRLFQVATLVVGGCHDRDFRKRRRHARSPRPLGAPGFRLSQPFGKLARNAVAEQSCSATRVSLATNSAWMAASARAAASGIA